jgi:hypothetical protein
MLQKLANAEFANSIEVGDLETCAFLIGGTARIAFI